MTQIEALKLLARWPQRMPHNRAFDMLSWMQASRLGATDAGRELMNQERPQEKATDFAARHQQALSSLLAGPQRSPPDVDAFDRLVIARFASSAPLDGGGSEYSITQDGRDALAAKTYTPRPDR